MTMLAIAIVLTLSAIAASSRLTPRKPMAWLLAACLSASLFLVGLYFFSDQFTGSGIDESVIFHLKADMGGADLMAFWPQLLGIAVFLVLLAWAAWHVGNTSLAPDLRQTRWLRYGAVSLLALIAITVNPATRDLLRLYPVDGVQHLLFSTPSPQPARPPGLVVPDAVELRHKPSFVYIYLESFERSYLDETQFPGLTPNLKQLESQALSFTDIDQAVGTGWTIAGMVASQCGIPLITPSHGNSLGGMVGSFLPKATCLGDVLKGQGYHLEYMGGAKLQFAGKGSFYQSHGFDRVQGFDELRRGLNDPRYRSGWGLFDDTLFEVAGHRFDELAKQHRPFGLFLLTLDTHHPSGHLSRSCRARTYADGSNSILNAVHCSDELIGKFVEFIRSHEAYKDVKIVLASDHLAMPNTASAQLNKLERRRNTFMVLSSDMKSAQVERPGTTLDIAPTLLSLLGSNTQGFGFGRNLLNDQAPTLEAETGRKLTDHITQARTWLHSLWRYPSVTEGFKVDLKNASLHFKGGQEVRFPALIQLDEDNTTNSIIFAFDSPDSLLAHARKMHMDQKFMWIDKCQKLDTQQRWLSKDYCMLSGRLGEKSIRIAKLDNDQIVEGISSDSNPENHTTHSAYTYNLAILEMLDVLGTSNAFHLNMHQGRTSQPDVEKLPNGENPVLLNDFSHVIFSQGYWGNASNARATGHAPSSRILFRRGLTLIGVNDTAPPIKLAHMDTCGSEVIDKQAPFQSITEALHATTNTFAAHVIVAHDSAVCGQNNLGPLLQGLPLAKLAEVNYRGPYIAALVRGHPVFEQAGAENQAIALALSGLEHHNHQRQIEPRTLPRVAHAGGGYDQKTYTNSIDALNANRHSFELFEIDFSWTSDNELVCLHDWEKSSTRILKFEDNQKKTLEAFKRAYRKFTGFTPCHLDSLASWLKKNPGKMIVTDVKDDNAKALRFIKSRYPNLQQRFIPQVYAPSEYYLAKALGFKKVIWTLYRYVGDNANVLAHLPSMDLFGLTMNRARADAGLAAQAYQATGVLSWVHTVNSEDERQKYQDLGVSSIYTDWLP